MSTRSTSAANLNPGDRITNSGTAVEGRIVDDVREVDNWETCWIQVTFTDGTTWDLESWGSEVTIHA